MKKKQYSVDGFVPRGQRPQLGQDGTIDGLPETHSARVLHTGENQVSNKVAETTPTRALGRSDIDDSLREIDDVPPSNKKLQRKQLKRDKKERRKKSKVRRIIKWFFILLLVIALGIGGFVVYRAITASDSVFEGSFMDIVKNEPLKEDANGRSNFLVFGTEGEGHPGANLTDSIMVVSVDQDKKDAYMISLPRDLWVEYAETCMVGNQGKLNAVYFCGSDDGADEPAGAKALSDKAGEITGLDIQYYVHINWTSVVQAVDAVGGVDVTIESSDPRGILDRNFDWVCKFQCYYVNYKNGEKVHLDGQHALALARARNASGGYGLPNGNFDREKNQQMIIKAVREKAVSVGTLTNLGAVTGLIDTLDNNFRTNIQTKEIRTLMDLGTKISSDSIISLSLNDEAEPMVTTGMYNGQSVVRPILGIFDYSGIAEYVKVNTTSDPFVKEKAQITVLNGSGVVGVAQTFADKLEEKGFIIGLVSNAPDGTYQPVEIYQVNKDKTATAAKLAELYGVTVKTTAPPASVTGETDFLIIVGSGQ